MRILRTCRHVVMRGPTVRRVVWAVPCFVLLASSVGWAKELRLRSVEVQRPVVEVFERCELTIHVDGEVENPFDPEQVEVRATFRPPHGQAVTVSGFYYQPFKEVREGNVKRVRAVGTPVWKVRWTPRRTGVWTYDVELTTPAGKQSLPGGNVEVIRSARRGFVQLDRTTGFFKFERGQAFVPVGENLCWASGSQPLREYERWFQDLVKQRANYVRLWLAPWSFRLETKDTGVGRYDLERAWILDQLLERSESSGLYWQLSLLDHGSFSRSQDPNWHNNPYNAQLGGMCRVPNEFVTNTEARKRFRQLLRYLVNRWGYSPHLVSWELFNEPDLSELDMKDLTPWVEQMGGFLKSIDPNPRPVTISFHHEQAPAIWQLPVIDTVQLHLYEKRDFGEFLCGPTIQDLREQFHKPVMVGEFGWITDFVRQVDTEGIHLHDGLWGSFMGGAMGGGLVWFWDTYVHPNGLERHYGALAKFLRGEPFKQRLRPLKVSFSQKAMAGCSVGTPARAYLWVKNRTHNVDEYLAYRAALAKQRLRRARGQETEAPWYPPQVITQGTVTVRGLDWLGRYRVEWWDPYQGTVISTSVQQVRGGLLTIEVPELSFDVAGKLIKLHWWQRS